MFYSCFTLSLSLSLPLSLSLCVSVSPEYYLKIYGQRTYKAMLITSFPTSVLHTATLDLCMTPCWPSRVYGAKSGVEERWSMPACRLAPCTRGHHCTSATPTTSRLCTHASRCRAGKHSNVTGASACVNCGAGERCMLLARHIRLLTQASLRAYSGAA